LTTHTNYCEIILEDRGEILMNTLRNKKGFTLIELLAVIVVLAIVTVLATRSILPFMSNAARDAFAVEANEAITGAQDAMSLSSIDSSVNPTKITEGEVTKYCFTLADLNALGLWQKDDDKYAGTVVVTPNGNAYTYAVEMYNYDFYVKTTSGQIKAEDDVLDNPKNINETGGVSIRVACS